MSSAPWIDLPEELLGFIANHLNGIDILRIRAVCKPWRSSILLRKSPTFPLKLPFPISPYDPSIHLLPEGIFSLSNTTTYLLEPLDQSGEAPYQAMLIRVKRGKTGNLLLVNSFSGDRLIRYWWKPFPKVLNLLDYRVTEVSKSYSMQFTERFGIEVPRFTYEHNEELAVAHVSRVVLSPISSYNGHFIFGIYKAASLFFMRAGDKKWSIIQDARSGTGYEDVAVHNGKCCAVANSGFIAVLNPSSINNVHIIPSPVTADPGRKYLVESMGDLYLVHGDMDPAPEMRDYWTTSFDVDTEKYFRERDTGTHETYEVRFKVYKLNEKLGSWDEAKSLEDRAFFPGEDCRFSVLAKDTAGCRGNCIYYQDHWRTDNKFYDPTNFDASLRGIQYREIGLFKFENGIAAPIVCSPSYINIFWPPPAWLRPSLWTDDENDDEEDFPFLFES